MKSEWLDESKESSDSNKGGDKSRRGWLTKFSTMKVGLLKHIKPATEPRHATQLQR